MKNMLEKKLLKLINQSDSPLSGKDIIKKLSLPPSKLKKVNEILKKLVVKKQLLKNKNLYWAPNNKNILHALVTKVFKTFAFAKIIDTNEEIFIPGKYMFGTLPGDKVIIKKFVNNRGTLLEGKILIIETFDCRSYLGKASKIDNYFFFYSDEINFPLKLTVPKNLELQDGQLIKIKIIYRGTDNYDHIARVESIIGNATNPEDCCKLILQQKHINTCFNKKTLNEAEYIFAKGISQAELNGRLDLRNEIIFTIDGADSKDLDDAISIKKCANNCWELGVHIADVSHYVKPGSSLDDEAFERGISIYYADSVIPMLPQKLSNGICSLNPNKSRLTFSVFITLDKNGTITSYDFKKSIIKSKVKGVYDEVNQILNNTASKKIIKKYIEVKNNLFLMEELANILTKKRLARGSLNLETKECKIKIDGNHVEIKPYIRGKAETIIEEFMLKANEAAAMFSKRENIPFIYRIHDNPSTEKLNTLFCVFSNLNLPKPKNGSQSELSKVLKKVEGTNLQFAVNNIILRSLAKAKYSSEYKPHYGLVLANYSHFTSPIRRYPDLMIHRIMSKYLEHNNKNKIKSLFLDKVTSVAIQSSICEKNADSIERECEDIYKAYYMSNYINQEFDGIVSSVAQHGFYVQLPNTVEGLVHKNTLSTSEYEYINMIELKNLKDNNCSIKIGDKVKVKLIKTDVFSGQIDFEMVLP